MLCRGRIFRAEECTMVHSRIPGSQSTGRPARLEIPKPILVPLPVLAVRPSSVLLYHPANSRVPAKPRNSLYRRLELRSNPPPCSSVSLYPHLSASPSSCPSSCLLLLLLVLLVVHNGCREMLNYLHCNSEFWPCRCRTLHLQLHSESLGKNLKIRLIAQNFKR